MRAEPAAPLRRAGNHSISVLTAFGGSPGAAEPPHAWGRASAASAPQTPGRAPPGWPRSVQPGPPTPQGTSSGPVAAHTKGATEPAAAWPERSPARAQPGVGTWICGCRGANHSKAKLAGTFCCVPRAPGLFHSHRSWHSQQHGEVHAFGNFLMHLQTPRAAVLSPTRMFVQSKLVAR